MLFFLKGLLMGVIVCTAPGPILTVIFKEGLKRGFPFAFKFGMGVALVDVVYCILAFAGITPFLAAYPSFVPTMWLLGGIIFGVIGIMDIYNMKKSHGHIEEPKKFQKMDFSCPFKKGLLISIFNPGALLFWISISTAFTFLGGNASTLFIAGVALGSPLLFLVLAHLISHLRGRTTEKFLYYFTYIAGIILIGTSVFFFYKFFTLVT